MELWLQILLIALLGAATLAIAIFSIIRYKKELAAAEITKEEYYAHIDAIETEASVEDAVSDSSDENLGIPEDVEIMDESEDTDVDESESVEDDED